jgi:hypothetical protein
MRKLYERSWLGVEFVSIAKSSPQVLASPVFWEAFYQAVFQQLGAWTEIDRVDPDFRNAKKAVAAFIFSRIKSRDNILSIGCGVGWIEHCLLEMGQGTMHLEVTDVAPAAFTLIRKELPASRVHPGFFPECIPADRHYSLIFMVDIDCTMDQSSLTLFLAKVKGRLTKEGRCLLISGTLDPPVSLWWKLLRAGKNVLAPLLEAAGLLQRGHFLGWYRHKEEFYQAFSRAGYSELREGFIAAGPNPVGYYWIEARNS